MDRGALEPASGEAGTGSEDVAKARARRRGEDLVSDVPAGDRKPRGYTADADGTAEKLAYDLWYLRHRSLVLDLAICVKTFSTLFTGSGAR